MSAILQFSGNELALPFSPFIHSRQATAELQYSQHQPFVENQSGIALIVAENYYRLAQQPTQVVSVESSMSLRDATFEVLSPAENTHLFEIASAFSRLLDLSSTTFANSRPLSREERFDLKKFYRKTYKKV